MVFYTAPFMIFARSSRSATSESSEGGETRRPKFTIPGSVKMRLNKPLPRIPIESAIQREPILRGKP